MIKHRTSRLWSVYFWFFPDSDPHNCIISFGPYIFVPTSKSLSLQDDIKVHEETHLDQMGRSYFKAIFMTALYLLSPHFRYKMELEAMAAQIKYIREKVFDDNQIEAFTHQLARELSGPEYRNMVSYSKAYTDLFNQSGQLKPRAKKYYTPGNR